MATLLELDSLAQDSDLQKKVAVALTKEAHTAITELPTVTNHSERVKYAVQVMAFPDEEGMRLVRDVLAENAGLTVAQIQGATDGAIETNVSASYTAIAVALFGTP